MAARLARDCPRVEAVRILSRPPPRRPPLLGENSGEAIDVESPSYIAQCKLVKTCSLETLTTLAEQVERQAAGKAKAGVVAIKLRRGRGRASPLLLVVTAATWERLNGAAGEENTHEC